MTFSLSIKTVEDKQAEAALARGAALKAETRNRIYAVVDAPTQASILAAHMAGNLTTAEIDIFRDGQAWIEATKKAARDATKSGNNPVWPEVPAGVKEFSDKY